jgi:hypothetical protein
MSGGRFDYIQYRLEDVVEQVENELSDNEGYSETVADILGRTVLYLKLATIYLNRVDWFLSGDDGEEQFVNRLKEDLDEFM